MENKEKKIELPAIIETTFYDDNNQNVKPVSGLFVNYDWLINAMNDCLRGFESSDIEYKYRFSCLQELCNRVGLKIIEKLRYILDKREDEGARLYGKKLHHLKKD